MLKPVQMSKIRVVCLKAASAQVIKSLHNLSVLHITDSKLPELDRAGPLPSYDDVSSRLVKIRAIKEALGTGGKLPKKKAAYENLLDETDEAIAKGERAFEIVAEREAISKELDSNLASQKALFEIESLNIDFSQLTSSTLQFLLVKVPKEKAKMASEILDATKSCTYTSSQAKSGAHAFIVALPRQADAKFLEGFGQALPLPQISSTPKAEIASLKQKEAEIRERLEVLAKRQSRLSDSLYPSVVSLEEALSIEADRAQIATSFGASASLYFIEGWAEHSRLHHIKSELQSQFGRKIHASSVPFSHDEVPPTLLSNPERAQPFEYLANFISTPQYYEVDPSIMLAIIIPLMYALIMGDAGYALISFFFALWLTTKSKKGELLHEVALIWAISAIPAFIAGIIFDEYFGFTHTHLISVLGGGHAVFYEGFHRVSSLTTLMFISIIIGMVHLSLGFIIGAINEWNHSKKHSAAKLCWLGILLGGFFAISGFMYGMFDFLAMPAAAVLGLSIVGLMLTEGVIAMVEIPGLLGNVMSYLRIAAVGVGGVIIAEAVNELLLPQFNFTLMGVIIFIITAILYVAMHAAACVLAMFEALVHGARLNVVEFFGKFYKGGGTRFSPFSSRRIYTQEV